MGKLAAEHNTQDWNDKPTVVPAYLWLDGLNPKQVFTFPCPRLLVPKAGSERSKEDFTKKKSVAVVPTTS